MDLSSERESEGFDLGNFLAKQSRLGAVDSSGEFSVSNARALEKLSHYALAGEYTWLLKLLQAVSMWRPNEIRIRQTREFTGVFFQPSVERPTEQELVEAFQLGLTNKSEPLPQFCLALRALVKQAGLSFVLSVQAGTEEVSAPIFSGDDLSKLSEKERLAMVFHSEPGIHLVIGHYKGRESFTGRFFPTFTAWERRDIKLAGLFEDNAIFHRTPIYLDGRLLNCPFTNPQFGLYAKRQPLFLSAPAGEDEIAGELRAPRTFRRVEVPLDEMTSERDFLPSVWYLLRTKTPRQIRGPMLGKAQHEMLWVKDGVIVERSVARGVTTATGLTLVFSAQGAGTDLSGLALIRSEMRERFQAAALKAVLDDVAGLAADFKSYELTRPQEQVVEESLSDSGPARSSWTGEVLPLAGFGVFGAITLGPAAPFWVTATLGAGTGTLVGMMFRRHRESEKSLEALTTRWQGLVKSDLDRMKGLSRLRFRSSRNVLGGGAEREALFQPRGSSDV